MTAKQLQALRQTAERLQAGKHVEPAKLRGFGAGVAALIAQVEQADRRVDQAKINRRASQLGITPSSQAAGWIERFERARAALKERGVRVSGPKGPGKTFELSGGGYNGHLLNVWEVIEEGEKPHMKEDHRE